jgi:CRISPR-associated protein Cas1
MSTSTVITGPRWDSAEALHETWAAFQGKGVRAPSGVAAESFGANPQARCLLLSRMLRAGAWHLAPLQASRLPKGDGGSRLLRVPALEDRVVLSSVARWLADAVDSRLHEASHAYRIGRGTATAFASVAAALAIGRTWAFKGDIRDFFDTVDPGLAVDRLKRWGLWADGLARVIRLAMRAEVADAAGAYCILRGLPQGSPLSPVLSNVALHVLDESAATPGLTWVRYADDFIILGESSEAVQAARARLEHRLGELGLALNDAKSTLGEPGSVLAFLGQQVTLEGGWTWNAEVAAPAQPMAQADGPAAEGHADLAVPQVGPGGEAPPSITATPLLRTLYIVNDGARLSRRGDALVVESPGNAARTLPGSRVNQVLAFGATSFSSGAVALCLEFGIPVMLTSGHGHRFGLIDPLPEPDLTLLAAQLGATRDEGLALEVARTIVVAKLRNATLALRRWQRHRPRDTAADSIRQVADAAHRARNARDVATLRGFEGAAGAAYFRAFAQWLPAHWGFGGRRRRPPPDPVNAMLSYGYTILYYNVLTLALARGLQPRVGFLHAARSGHHALASDLMEPFRPMVVDTVVMDLACRGRVKPDDFSAPTAPGQACLMRPDARQRLIQALELRLNTRLQLRGTALTLDLRRLIDLQTLSLADRLRGRSTRFEAFVAR